MAAGARGRHGAAGPTPSTRSRSKPGRGGLVYRFVTPWKPPTAFFQRVSELWPTLVFVLDYEEPRMAFRGLARAANGTLDYIHIDL